MYIRTMYIYCEGDDGGWAPDLGLELVLEAAQEAILLRVHVHRLPGLRRRLEGELEYHPMCTHTYKQKNLANEGIIDTVPGGSRKKC